MARSPHTQPMASAAAPRIRIGASLTSVFTPCLLVSLPQLEANDSRMRALLQDTGVALRPHAKAHKSSAVSMWQASRAEAERQPVAGFCAH